MWAWMDEADGAKFIIIEGTDVSVALGALLLCAGGCQSAVWVLGVVGMWR